jgi:DNA-binding CsgD family transcriptional regulator
MGQHFSDVYDEARVASIANRLASAIDAAAFATGTWDSLPEVFSDAFPGSFGALWNMNFTEPNLNFLAIQNMDPAFVRSFNEHFAYVNPWSNYWQTAPVGAALSEDVCPARRFADTEFYNDWLMPQKDVEAAAGIKLVGDRQELVQFMIHYPLAQSDRYGQAALEVLHRVRGNIERSIDLARLMRGGAEARAAGAALVERSHCAAFVLDDERHVRDANAMAVDLFSAGSALSVRNNECHLADRNADARFGMMLQRLSKNVPVEGSPLVFHTVDGAWQVVLAGLPTPSWSPPVLSLLPPRRLILVLVNDLRPQTREKDLSSLATAFGLTPAEIRFCRHLMLGASVADAAEHTGVTVETARTRLKSIFQKTGLSRQAQLMMLLSRLL